MKILAIGRPCGPILTSRDKSRGVCQLTCTKIEKFHLGKFDVNFDGAESNATFCVCFVFK